MDDIVIDDILEVIDDVAIKELVYKEEGRLRLAREQIEQEVGNLIAGQWKYMRRIKVYSDLFAGAQASIPRVATVLPVIDDAKYMHEDSFDPTSHYKIDIELDEQNNLKGRRFLDFVDTYSKLNRDRESPYVHTSRTLYSLFRPYDFSKGAKVVEVDVDCVWSGRREFSRLISKVEIDLGHKPDVIDAEYLKEFSCPQGRKYIERPIEETVYAGDAPTVVGFENVVDEEAPSKTFSLREYKKALRELSQGENVTLAFNTLAFDRRHRRIDRMQGNIVENTGASVRVSLDKIVHVGVDSFEEIEIPFDRYFPVYCYASAFEPKFAKLDLLTENYRFDFKDERYVFPQTWSEYAHLRWDEIASQERFMRVIGFENAEIDMLPALRNAFHSKNDPMPYAPPARVYKHASKYEFFDFSANAEFLKCYDSAYRLSGTYVDGDLARYAYLKNALDNGLCYAISFAEKKRMDPGALERAIEGLDKELKTKTAAEVYKPPRLAKRYESASAIEADQGKTIYYDKNLDPTQYTLKTKSNLEGNALEEYLSKRLEGDRFEIESVIAGKRPVRLNDLAIVEVNGRSTTYKRTIVGKTHMWVKTDGAPTCTSETASFEELSSKSAMIVDPYDDLCKKAAAAVEQRKRIAAADASRMLSEALESAKEDRVGFANRVAAMLQLQQRSTFRRSTSNSMFGYIDKISYDEYFGSEDAIDLDNMFMNFAYGAGPTAMNYAPAAPAEPEKRTIVDILCKALEIDGLDDATRKYINEYIDDKLPDDAPNQEIQKRLQELNKQVDKLLIENRKKPPEVQRSLRIKLEAKKLEMIEQERAKRLFPHNFEKVTLCCAMLVLIILIQHPSIAIHRLMPGCVKYFSYLSYPLIEEEKTSRSLIKYVACVLKTLHQPKDPRFGLFGDVDDNAKAILVSVKKVLLEKSDLRKHVSAKKITEEDLPSEMTYDQLNTFFKPCFEFARESYENAIVQYMKEIHSIVSKSRMSRFNMINMPLIANTCCIEILDRKTNFYDFFDSDSFKKARQRANALAGSARAKRVAWVPPSVPITHEDIFSKKKIEPAATTPIEDMSAKEPEKIDDKSPSWWDDVAHPENRATFSYLESLMPKSKNIARVRSLFVEIEDLSNVSALRNAYASFLRGAFRTFISKLANGYRFKKDEKYDKNHPFVALLETANGFEKFQGMMKRASTLLESMTKEIKYDSSSQLVSNAVHDVMRFTKKLCDFAMRALWLSTEKPTPESIDAPTLALALQSADSACTRLMIQTVRLAFEALAEHADANYFDLSEIKKEVEMLRERRKLEIMAKYSADDEERSQQIILKKIGYDKWDDVDGPAPAEPEPPVVEAVEPEYGAYVEDRGENADDDVDHEGYD